MQFSIVATMFAVLATGVVARNCTPDLNYCGSTLLSIGNYGPQIDQAIHDANQPEENSGKDDLFHCVAQGENNQNGLITWIAHCPNGCSDNGEGKNDASNGIMPTLNSAAPGVAAMTATSTRAKKAWKTYNSRRAKCNVMEATTQELQSCKHTVRIDEVEAWKVHTNPIQFREIINSLLTIFLWQKVMRDLGYPDRQEARNTIYNHAKDIYDADYYETDKIIVSQANRKVRDRQCSTALGLPTRIRDEGCDIEILDPSDFEEEDHSTYLKFLGTQKKEHVLYAIQMAKLIVYLGKIVLREFAPVIGPKTSSTLFSRDSRTTKTWDVTNWVLQLFFQFLDQSTATKLQLVAENEDPPAQQSATGSPGPQDSSDPAMELDSNQLSTQGYTLGRNDEFARDNISLDIASHLFGTKEAKDFSLFQLQPDLFSGDMFDILKPTLANAQIEIIGRDDLKTSRFMLPFHYAATLDWKNEGNMDSQPQEPKRSHTKNISVVSTTSRDSMNMDDRRPAARRPMRKFGTGKNAGVELDPQPSDSPRDPLNWPQWKKELAFGSLLLGTAVVGMLKTILVTVGSVLATEFNVSYMSITALTGLPLIFGGLAGMKSVVLSQIWGKRAIYLVSSVVMLLAAVWNMHVFGSYGQFMVSRLFQGIAWGSFESLVLLSVKDMYFAHERNSRITIYNITNIFFTWGSPMVGGIASQRLETFRNEIMIVNVIQAFSIVFLGLITPETTYYRDTFSGQSVGSSHFQTTITTQSSVSGFKSYVHSLRLTNSNSTAKFSISRALLPLRALIAPSTVLTFLLTAPLMATAYGVANILSELFSPQPIMAFPTAIGLMFTVPLIASLLTYAKGALISHLVSRNNTSSSRYLAVGIPGLLIGFIGILAFGLYTDGTLRPVTKQSGVINAFYAQGQDLSERIVSVVFGLLVSGAILLNYAGVSQLKAAAANSDESDVLENGHRVLQDIFSGIFVIGMPLWVPSGGGMLDGLKETSIALAVVVMVMGSSACAALWVFGEKLGKVDGRVLRRERREGAEMAVQMQKWKSAESFLEG
ncbi:hypothetical protein G7Y89_g2466 [Cudoniella acicularis]|uniref:Major facilitator superfamily (MFS) profile domain-containing protein n=1 Tax=Cudoniella acicularis TaxID=354080 RepID=A0A8H4RTE5_9HELO|nr:hypothetical protein G7Y89_g2466 [Cudoniella acicularis]